MNSSQPVLERNVIEYGSTAVPGVRFPTRVTFTQTFNDKVAMTEDLSIELIDLNQPIDPVTFSLAGIPGITLGTPILWVSDDLRREGFGGLVWDGKSVVSAIVKKRKE